MTEYINKEQLDRKFIIEMLSPSTNTIFDAKDIIDGLPTADVIERSKIDKALEMTYKVREMVLHSNRTYEVNDVLDIIDEISAYFERHIGE